MLHMPKIGSKHGYTTGQCALEMLLLKLKTALELAFLGAGIVLAGFFAHP